MGGNLHHLETKSAWLSFQGACSGWVAQRWAGWGHCQGELMGSLTQLGRWDNYGELTGLKAWKSTAATLAAPTQESKDWWIKYVPLSFWNLSKGQACDMDWAHQSAPEMVDPARMENLITFPAWAPWLIAVCGNLSKYCLDQWQSVEKGFLQPRRRKESVEPKAFLWMHCSPKFSWCSWPEERLKCFTMKPLLWSNFPNSFSIFIMGLLNLSSQFWPPVTTPYLPVGWWSCLESWC